MAIVRDFLKNKFKENVKKGNMQFGVAMEIPSPDVAEVLASLDFDWLFIDGEHGGHTVESIIRIAQTIQAYEVEPVVRVSQAGTGIIKQLMDNGIKNIIFPKVDTPEEAENIVYWSSFAPRGNRGFGATATRAGLYGLYADYETRIKDESLMLIQIESKKGYQNLDKILAVPDLQGIFLGPVDLAVDMGHGINIFHPEVVAAIDDMIKRIVARGIPVGTITVSPEQTIHYKELGVSFLASGADTILLHEAAAKTLALHKTAIENK